MFLGIDHARFIHRQVLESPRGREELGVRAASPVLDGKQVELLVGGRRWSALGGMAFGGAGPALVLMGYQWAVNGSVTSLSFSP